LKESDRAEWSVTKGAPLKRTGSVGDPPNPIVSRGLPNDPRFDRGRLSSQLSAVSLHGSPPRGLIGDGTRVRPMPTSKAPATFIADLRPSRMATALALLP